MGAVRTKMSGVLVLVLLCCSTGFFVRSAMAQEGISTPDTTVYNFQDVYEIQWGGQHINFMNNGSTAQMVLDQTSGAGFQSISNYTFGFFGVNMKLVPGYSAGVVAAFFVSSEGPNHDEIDFEFLGNVSGNPYNLQTNLFANGTGGREQKIELWFDPTADFHTYQIIWNHEIITWFVDGTPIRVYKNLESVTGQAFPTSQPAQVIASLFDGSGWATRWWENNIIPANYTYAPFDVEYSAFQVDACVNDGVTVPSCSTNYQINWWEGSDYSSLSASEISALTNVLASYSTYDYCHDPTRYDPPPVECSYNYDG